MFGEHNIAEAIIVVDVVILLSKQEPSATL
jgi:hypothetical protein